MGRIQLSQLAELSISRSLSLRGEFIKITGCAPETATDGAIVQAELWTHRPDEGMREQSRHDSTSGLGIEDQSVRPGSARHLVVGREAPISSQGAWWSPSRA